MAMAKNPTAADLIAHFNAEENVILEGRHGVGKTFVADEAAQKAGLNMMRFDASMIDPYIDLVGIPEVITDKDGNKTMKQVRKQDIDEAEVLFFDEFNRAEVATHNAIFSLIQFHAINGVKLPKLKAVICAQNPADDDAYVGASQLDAALLDRFDAAYTLEPVYSKNFYTKALGDKDVAAALVAWVDDLDEDKNGYISPRRLEKIGRSYLTHKSKRRLSAALPLGSNIAVNDLWNRLNGTAKDAFPDTDPIDDIIKNRRKVVDNVDKISEAFVNFSADQRAVLSDTISTKVGAASYGKLYDIIEALAAVNPRVTVDQNKYDRIAREMANETSNIKYKVLDSITVK